MGIIVASALATFIYRESKVDEPILPIGFFKNKNFVLLMGIASLFGAGFMGSILYLTQFNQQVFGATPTESGSDVLPMIGGLDAFKYWVRSDSSLGSVSTRYSCKSVSCSPRS